MRWTGLTWLRWLGNRIVGLNPEYLAMRGSEGRCDAAGERRSGIAEFVARAAWRAARVMQGT